MRNVKYLNFGQQTNQSERSYATAMHKRILPPRLSTDPTSATLLAVEEISEVVSNECFNHPDTLTQEGIQAYALALLRLREYAGMAGMERLMNACDALAVTVSKLIDDRNNATRDKCQALKRFVVHAREMVLMSVSQTTACVILSMPNETRQMNAAA